MAIAGNLLSENAESVETDASAWSALVNAPTPTRGSGGTSGSYCLSFKATAAGDCQIGLTSRVGVTAGDAYFACASIFPPAASAQSRIEIRWHNASGTLISTTQGPMVAAPTVAWHQVGAYGTAPTGATTANVVIRVTGTAANQSWYADRMFLGLPDRPTGNVLPFNGETMELDATGWSAHSNAALTISKSAHSWFQALQMTANAAGSTVARTASAQAPAVTAGAEYIAYVYALPGQAGIPLSVQIVWLDAGGAEVGVSSSSRTTPTDEWTKVAVVATAPASATKARVAVAATASAAGQTWVIDRAVLAPTSALMSTGNLLPYNVSDVEQDTSGWTVTGGTAEQSYTQALGGRYSLKVTATGGDLIISTAVPITAVTPGVGFQFSPALYKVARVDYQTRIEWLNAAGDAVRTRWQGWSGALGLWQAGGMGDLAPDDAVSVRLSVVVPNSAPGDVLYLDRVAWAEGGLTAKAVLAGGGGVLVTVSGLTTGGPELLWSIVRLAPGVAEQPVRGWDGDLTAKPITGDASAVTDYEVPLGVPVQWRVLLRDTAGVLRQSYTSDPVTVPATPTQVWLKDPGLPQRSVAVTVGTPMPTWRQPARQGVNQVRGRRLPVVITDVRSGKTGDITVITETPAEREALDWVLSSGSVLLLQWPPGWGEADMYVSVGDVSLAPVADFAEFHDRTWTLPLTEVDRPTGGVTGSADRTWQTVKNSGATWADVLTGKTWLNIYVGG